ncbi:hypothetical protein G5B30_16005 [Sphingobacterium sp. SGG-5]|nr:hypothetical protein [Sphingobacterium sp. SGG-5]NGM63415.1 hypothetical protein [Sphingobacterium sp. SGG-5]
MSGALGNFGGDDPYAEYVPAEDDDLFPLGAELCAGEGKGCEIVRGAY